MLNTRMKSSNLERLLSFTNSYYKLKEIYRTGWIQKLGIEHPETVASHTLLMIVFILFFSDKYSFSNQKKMKLIEMVLIHDLGESIIGDLTPESMDKNEKMVLENNAVVSILEKMPFKKLKNNYLKIWREYNVNRSFESKFVHLVDKLEMVMQARYYLDSREGLKRVDVNPFFQSALIGAGQRVFDEQPPSNSRKQINDKKLLEEIKEILAHLCK